MLRILLLCAVLGLLASPLWLTALALDPLPRVLGRASLSVDDVENARRLLRENDPRRLREGENRRVVLSERELNLLLGYLLPADRVAARAGLSEGLMTITASARLPSNPLGSYLNVDALLLQRARILEPAAVSLGGIQLPAWAVRGIAQVSDWILRRQLPEYRLLLESLESIEAGDGTLSVGYRWQTALLDQIRSRGQGMAMPGVDRDSMLAYREVLARRSATLPPGASLAELLGPLFSVAAERSRAGADPEAENRTLLLALGMAVQGVDPAKIAGTAAPTPGLRRLRVSLRGRRDLAQHFTVSAALAAGGGSQLADALGVFKELSDSQGGSGFSFADLLADRAGVVFAERVTGEDAGRMQRLLAAGGDEALFMPPIDDLPEGLQELEFRSRYEDLDAGAYRAAQQEMERRIAELQLYR